MIRRGSSGATSTIRVAGSTAATTARLRGASQETLTAASPRTAAATQSSISSWARPLRATISANSALGPIGHGLIAIDRDRKAWFGGEDVGRDLAQQRPRVVQGQAGFARFAAAQPLVAGEERGGLFIAGQAGAVVFGQQVGWPSELDHG